MLVSGENYVLTPKTRDLSFVFDNFYVDEPGVVEIGFSGEGNKIFFLSSGGRILDPDNKFIYTHDSNETISISGDINASNYRYYINDELSADGKTKLGFNIDKFYINTTDCQAGLDLQMACPPISYKVEFDEQFVAGGTLNGLITNYSNIGFTILESRLENDGFVANYSGYVTGLVPALGTLSFQLYDISDVADENTDGTLKLATTMGSFSHVIDTQRVSGFFFNDVTLTVTQDSLLLQSQFSGSGNHEEFTWKPFFTQEQGYVVNYNVLDAEGLEAPRPLYVSLENVSPTNSGIFTGSYVNSYFTYDPNSYYCTGENIGCSDSQYTTKTTCENASETWGQLLDICKGQIHGSGSYSGVPHVEFLSYQRITGLTFNKNNLLSSGTPDKIPVIISGYEGELGTGASGYLLTGPIQINAGDPFGQGNGIDWKTVTGYEMTNFGTGYTKLPLAIATTGDERTVGNEALMFGFTIGDVPSILSHASYDPAYNKNVFTYSKLKVSPVGEYQAAYLTGLPYFENTGNSVYGLSGILITNPGSGYEPTVYKPRLNFIRQDTDTLGTRGLCSDSQFTTQTTCEGAGTCSDSQHNNNKSACETIGTCSDSSFNNNKAGCEAAGETFTQTNTWTPTPKVWVDHGDNHSGEFFFNKQGQEYNFTGLWNLISGVYITGQRVGVNFRSGDLVQNNKYVDSGWLPTGYSTYFVAVSCDNLDIDEVPEAKLTISGEGIKKEITLLNPLQYSTYSGMAYILPDDTAGSAGTNFYTTYFGS